MIFTLIFGFWMLHERADTLFFGKDATWMHIKLSFVANNVLILKKYRDNIDPESFGYSSDNLMGMESTGLPTTRSLGFNLNVKF